MINLSIKSSVNLFVDIPLTFLDSSCYSFLFDVTFFVWLSKSVLFTKLGTSFLLAKFARLNYAADVTLLNSEVVIYLSWLWSVIFFFNFINFCVIVS